MPDYSLTLTRKLKAPAAALFRCWTEPDLIKQFFCPPPWKVTQARVDLRPGGEFFSEMEGPAGERAENLGQVLYIEQNRRLVFSDAYTGNWVPSAKPFMTADLTFENTDAGTLYTAIARHWSEQDMKEHEAMGFHEGWGIVADQLDALAQTL